MGLHGGEGGRRAADRQGVVQGQLCGGTRAPPSSPAVIICISKECVAVGRGTVPISRQAPSPSSSRPVPAPPRRPRIAPTRTEQVGDVLMCETVVALRSLLTKTSSVTLGGGGGGGGLECVCVCVCVCVIPG